MRILANDWPPGELQSLGRGDVVEFIPSVEAMGTHWVAIGVAVLSGAELRIRDTDLRDMREAWAR